MRAGRLQLWVIVGALGCLLGAVSACGGGSDGEPGADVGGEPVDVVAVADVAADGSVAGDAVDAAPDVPPDIPEDVPVGLACDECPPEHCDPTSGRCLACTDDDDCLRGEWCREGGCVRTLCIPHSTACEDFDIKTCQVDGGGYLAPVACPENEFCSATPEGAACLPRVCEPGEEFCEEMQVSRCNDAGTGYMKFPCQPGAVCEGEEGCVPYRNTIVLIFDTSGSMDAGPFGGSCDCPNGDCDRPYPACENPLCPKSKLGLSKKSFLELFSVISTGNLHFVMTRFPQRVSRSQGDCGDMFGTGHYQVGMMDSTYMTNDDDSHEVPDGGYFDQYLHEVLSVGFPETEEDDTFAEARVWMNFDEVVDATDEPCEADEDCPAGFCDPGPFGAKVCFRHSDPELRATGSTPLGRSLFYAGEYIRKYVAPTGKPCVEDADCRNVNYQCGADGTCFDPLGHCRQVSIILFTDGIEDPATDAGDFFNPRQQAKRMRYGLTCQMDADCGEGASCDAGRCDDYARINGTSGTPPTPQDPTPPRLRDYRGQPLQVTTHVIDMGDGEGSHTNRLIADEGGGFYFSVSADNPASFINALISVTDIKQSLVCIPEFPWEN